MILDKPLVLIRHGQTNWNMEGRWQGQSGPPLNERGREQALRAAKFHRRFGLAVLYSSDLRRCHRTVPLGGIGIGSFA